MEEEEEEEIEHDENTYRTNIVSISRGLFLKIYIFWFVELNYFWKRRGKNIWEINNEMVTD